MVALATTGLPGDVRLFALDRPGGRIYLDRMRKSSLLVSAVAGSVLCLAVAPPAVAATNPPPRLTPAVFFAFTTTAVDIAQAPGLGSPAGDIAELAFIVLMEATNDQDRDLEEIMAEVKAQTSSKQSLRRLQADQTRLEAALAAAQGGCTKPC